MPRAVCRIVPLLLLAALFSPASAEPARPLEFHLTFAEAVSARPFTGRVYVMLSKSPIRNVPRGPNWFRPEPFFALDVKGWRPGEVLALKGDALGCPTPLAKLPKGAYHIQAVMDFDQGEISFAAATGNGHSKAVRRDLDPASTGPVALTLDQVYQPSIIKETERVKFVEIESKLLTDFHARPTRLRAGVVLPASFAKEPGRRYPVVYEVPGFSGTHAGALNAAARDASNVAGVEMLWVVLDPSCRHGHHVFADSANNGPCGQALIEELVPHIEGRFRGIGKAQARFVTGHSSGGWSSLWLQVAYPHFFGGVWSTAPDPVTFSDFQRIDLYKSGVSMFADEAGKPRPLARRGGKVALWYKDFSDMEEVMGHGGQLASFEAVFSGKGTDGRPRKLWDRRTGAVDGTVAKSWEKYDIRLVLERDWRALAPKLTGKVHVYMGREDTFYLEGATLLLKKSLQRLGSDAVVEVFPGYDHSTLMTDRKLGLRQRIAREMAARYRAARPES